MSYLFSRSKFNGDISKWNVSNVTDMSDLFYGSQFNGDISNWDVSNVIDMYGMFEHSNFKQDISKWNVSKVTNMRHMFYKCLLEENKPEWYQEEIMVNAYEDDDVREDFINEDFHEFAIWLYEHIKYKPEIKKLRDQYIDEYYTYFMDYVEENYDLVDEE